MAAVMEIVKWALANWQNMVIAVQAVLAALIGVALLIPGEQPDNFLQGLLDSVLKFSVKKSEESK